MEPVWRHFAPVFHSGRNNCATNFDSRSATNGIGSSNHSLSGTNPAGGNLANGKQRLHRTDGSDWSLKNDGRPSVILLANEIGRGNGGYQNNRSATLTKLVSMKSWENENNNRYPIVPIGSQPTLKRSYTWPKKQQIKSPTSNVELLTSTAENGDKNHGQSPIAGVHSGAIAHNWPGKCHMTPATTADWSDSNPGGGVPAINSIQALLHQFELMIENTTTSVPPTDSEPNDHEEVELANQDMVLGTNPPNPESETVRKQKVTFCDAPIASFSEEDNGSFGKSGELPILTRGTNSSVRKLCRKQLAIPFGKNPTTTTTTANKPGSWRSNSIKNNNMTAAPGCNFLSKQSIDAKSSRRFNKPNEKISKISKILDCDPQKFDVTSSCAMKLCPSHANKDLRIPKFEPSNNDHIRTLGAGTTLQRPKDSPRQLIKRELDHYFGLAKSQKVPDKLAKPAAQIVDFSFPTVVETQTNSMDHQITLINSDNPIWIPSSHAALPPDVVSEPNHLQFLQLQKQEQAHCFEQQFQPQYQQLEQQQRLEQQFQQQFKQQHEQQNSCESTSSGVSSQEEISFKNFMKNGKTEEKVLEADAAIFENAIPDRNIYDSNLRAVWQPVFSKPLEVQKRIPPVPPPKPPRTFVSKILRESEIL